MFMDDFQNYITDLKKEIPNLVICGDYNICHEAIDIHDPIQIKKVSGFYRKKELGLMHLNNGFIDSFSFLNKEPDNYTWTMRFLLLDSITRMANRLLFSEPLKERIKELLFYPKQNILTIVPF
jgi:exodeoxyribonuclease-3